MMEELRVAIRKALADAFVMYTEAHIFHWNVEGESFYAYHKLFNDIYEDVYDSIDNIAERLRTTGGYAPVSVHKLLEGSSIGATPAVTTPADMVARLIDTNASVISSLKSAYTLADDAGMIGLANYLADRVDQHMKWNWFLRASNKKD